MAKVKTHLVDRKEKYRIIGEMYEIISNLKTKKEIVDFFMGLLTPSESLMLARRIQVAEMLMEEKNYDEISKKLRVSFQTIAKVYQWLHGENEGYKHQILEQIKRKERRSKRKSDTYESLLDRYPHHRFLKELLS
ncbi:MAG: YerC/YecD family TrpR-related protein [Candidatus Moranbacteria bacterium]|nr:YerC/YecD family TrpR-related protein [Candidatus Moranbacteria bacterium]